MSRKYYTYRIHITNRDHVQAEVRDTEGSLLGEPSGKFSYRGDIESRIRALHESAGKGSLLDDEIEELGELLFTILLDEKLRHDFFIHYQKSREEGALLRIELDIDEQNLPDIAALPWEFLHVPFETGYGTVWLATAPDVVFSRRRALWKAAQPIQLHAREYLRIAVAVAVPNDLGAVEYQDVLTSLERLAHTERIELLEPVLQANKANIDRILEKNPHIFHFLGHAKFFDETDQQEGQIALVGADGQMERVSAEVFSELFNRHQPGIVVLQSCESGTLSASKAFVGIASRIVQQNIPVVVAMQYKVSNTSATQFALEFYRRLAENEPVDKAMQEGRRRIALGSKGYKHRDFATPLLLMRVRDGHLFQRQPEMLDDAERTRLKDEAKRQEQDQKFDAAIKLWKDIRDFGPEASEAKQMIETLHQQKLVNLKQTARKLERNQAYHEAIAAWQEIGLAETESFVAEREIERLHQQEQQRGSLQDLQQQLLCRMVEIKDIFVPVATRLKQMQKDDIDEKEEILIEIVKQFLMQNLSAQDFSEMWQQTESKTASPKQEAINYEALVARLQRGEIIPVLGPEVHHRSGLSFPSSEALVQTLAQGAKYDGFSGPLSMISQYYEMTEYGRSTLLQSVRDEIEPKTVIQQPYPLYQLLANIKEPILVISACYDRLLEQYFTDSKKRFVMISHIKIGNNLGKLLLKYSDKSKPENPCTAEAISPLKLLESRYSVIYKVCGCFGMCSPEMEAAMDSIMISDEDYFSFAKQTEKVIPGYLANQIARQSLLFLGNPMKDWQDRLILNTILEKRETRNELSYAVKEDPTLYESAYWKSHRVDLYQVSLKAFVEKLQRNM